jgi:hypothetical protein
LRAVAAGELAVDEAKDLSAVIETHRRTIETVELEARIAQLENARSQTTEPDQSGVPDVQPDQSGVPDVQIWDQIEKAGETYAGQISDCSLHDLWQSPDEERIAEAKRQAEAQGRPLKIWVRVYVDPDPSKQPGLMEVWMDEVKVSSNVSSARRTKR